MANNLTRGEHLISKKNLNDNIPLFTELFEVRAAHSYTHTYIHTYIYINIHTQYFIDWAALQDNESGQDAQYIRQADVHSDGHRELPG